LEDSDELRLQTFRTPLQSSDPVAQRREVLVQISQERLVCAAVFLDLIGQSLATISQSLHPGFELADTRRNDVLQEAPYPLCGIEGSIAQFRDRAPALGSVPVELPIPAESNRPSEEPYPVAPRSAAGTSRSRGPAPGPPGAPAQARQPAGTRATASERLDTEDGQISEILLATYPS